MRYFSYNEGDEVVTVSEDDIRQTYYPHWRTRMAATFGEDVVPDGFWFQDCLDDWVVLNGAWEAD